MLTRQLTLEVYYVNTHTGESSWEIPNTSPTGEGSGDEEDFYYSNNTVINNPHTTAASNRQSGGNGVYQDSAPSSLGIPHAG
jgi:hypothetical protein